jgi:hypothetical protein
LVEQRPFKAWVAGSIPAALTIPPLGTLPKVAPASTKPHSQFKISSWKKRNFDAMIQTRCSALLFDLDGVLIDSTPAVARVWRRWAPSTASIRDRGPHGARASQSNHHPRTDARRRISTQILDKEDREVERREIEDLDGVVLLPGAGQLLNSLPPDRWTIATSCTRPLGRSAFAGRRVCLFPKNMITSSDVKIGKPDPEPYLKAAARSVCRLRLHRGRRCARWSSRGQSRRRQSDCVPHDHAHAAISKMRAPIGSSKIAPLTPRHPTTAMNCTSSLESLDLTSDREQRLS